MTDGKTCTFIPELHKFLPPFCSTISYQTEKTESGVYSLAMANFQLAKK